jgi:Cu+-exporting ATPase
MADMTASTDHEAPAGGRALDPVCGMTVDPPDDAASPQPSATTYFFCSGGCRAKFAADPRNISDPAPPGRDRDAGGNGLHLSDASGGSASRAGLLSDLRHGARARDAEAQTGPITNLLDMTRRLWIALALSVPVVALDMADTCCGCMS